MSRPFRSPGRRSRNARKPAAGGCPSRKHPRLVGPPPDMQGRLHTAERAVFSGLPQKVPERLRRENAPPPRGRMCRTPRRPAASPRAGRRDDSRSRRFGSGRTGPRSKIRTSCTRNRPGQTGRASPHRAAASAHRPRPSLAAESLPATTLRTDAAQAPETDTANDVPDGGRRKRETGRSKEKTPEHTGKRFIFRTFVHRSSVRHRTARAPAERAAAPADRSAKPESHT